jgi:hypothetical protein
MKCSICNKNISGQYFNDDKGNTYCSNDCWEEQLPKCSNCGKKLNQWIESKSGNKYCDDKCYEIELPKCDNCGKRMKEWKVSESGNKYCNDKCYEIELPKCDNCGKRMKEWKISESGNRYCDDKCYEIELPKCDSCGKSMNNWIESKEKLFCNEECMGDSFEFYRIDDVRRKMKPLGGRYLEVLLVGATGVGKSMTVNALKGTDDAEVGYGVDPKTMQIGEYALDNNIRIWDTPGFGDGVERDIKHKKKIIDMLNTRMAKKEHNGFIDMVVLVLEASLRDMGTAFQLINEVILPNLKSESRLIIGLNQADFAMKGKHFDHSKNKPTEELKRFLDDKVNSINMRFKESLRNDLIITYYSAETGYNVEEFLDSIIDNIPRNERLI